ncbi:CU044_5270 family protein [Streptomyces sp. NBC_00289]|uniref:CU044_5270 family protein n=1 Tax=Streptomyces sp. NBC_00289 TaxID=2975703 RepID=UPI00324EF3D7
MDDLTAVRELADGVAPVTDEARSAAHARLRNAIAAEGGHGAFSRRLMLRVAVASAAAAAVAGGVVVAARRDQDSAAPRMTTLSAAQLLHRAADRSRADGTRTPVPRNDQYVYTKNYVTRTYVKDGRTKTWTDESWLSVDGSKPSRRQEHGEVHHDPPLGKHEVMWPPTEYTKLAKWPTDPDTLLKWFRGTPGGDMEAFMNAIQLFVVPRVMPPGLEAATFEAVAKIPGIRLDDEVDALGRRGIGVSYPKLSFTFIFDSETYAYLGLRLKGSTVIAVGKGFRSVGWYHEMRSLQELRVVDRIGQRRPGERS